jgi:hypothetical protein
MMNLRALKLCVALLSAMGSTSYSYGGSQFVDPPRQAMTQNMRYNGCGAGMESFRSGVRKSPYNTCVDTIGNRICKINAETCCFRLCVFDLSGKVSTAKFIKGDRPLGYQAMLNRVNERHQELVNQAKGDADGIVANIFPPKDVFENFESCVFSCADATKNRLGTSRTR